MVNHGMHDRDNDNSFVSELNDINIKFSYTFRFKFNLSGLVDCKAVK